MNKDEQKEKKERRSPAEVSALQERVIAVKKRLPAGTVATFVSRYPEYNTYKKSSRVNNVVLLRIVDEEITNLLEQLADEFEAGGGKKDEIIQNKNQK